MPPSLLKTLIIGTLVLLLNGCASVRLAYGQGPTLVWWWLDGYLDLDSAQAARAKPAIAQWFEWHRATQLGDYASLLAAMQADAAGPLTPAQVCRWQQRLRDALQPALDRGVQQGAALVPALTEAQLKHLESEYAKKNDKWKRDFLQPDRADRREAAIDRARESVERLYGRLDEAQERILAAGIDASPSDPQAALAERQRRQRDVVQTLRQLLAEHAGEERIAAALHGLVERAERSPDPVFRAYQQRMTDHGCGISARVHNAASPAQRRTARERLKGWEDDVRALQAAGG